MVSWFFLFFFRRGGRAPFGQNTHDNLYNIEPAGGAMTESAPALLATSRAQHVLRHLSPWRACRGPLAGPHVHHLHLHLQFFPLC